MPAARRLLIACLLGSSIAFTAAEAHAAQFGGPTQLAAPSTVLGIASGDFAGNGHAGLAALSLGGVVSVYLGSGDGTLQPRSDISLNDTSVTGIATADLRGLGRSDIVVGTGSGVSILLSNGDGTFQQAPSLSTATSYAVAVGDIDGDGHPDVVAGSGSSLAVFAGRGDGTFAPPVTYSTGWAPLHIAMADLTGRGADDVIADTSIAGVKVFLGNADGSLQDPTTYLSGTDNPGALAGADLRGVGRSDLLVATAGHLAVLLSNPDGTLAAPVYYPVAHQPRAIVAAQLTTAGRVDVAADTTGSILVLPGNGDGTLGSAVSYPFGDVANGLVAAALTDGARPDLVVGRNFGRALEIYRNLGDGTFSTASRTGGHFLPWDMRMADLRGAGKQDLIIADRAGSQVLVELGNGDGTFQTPASYALPGHPSGLVLADLRQSGHLDIAVVSDAASGLSVLIANGDGTFQAAVSYPTTAAADLQVTAGNFFGHGRMDLAIVGTSNPVRLYVNASDGTFPTSITWGVQGTAQNLTTGDFTGSGHADLAVTTYNPNRVVVLLNNGLGQFQEADYTPAGVSWGLAALDLRGTGRSDLAVTLVDVNRVQVMLSSPGGSFTFGSAYDLGAFPSRAVPTQFDGHASLVTAVTVGGGIAVLVGNGDGTFQPPVTYSVGLSTYAVAVGDVNGDGIPDLVSINQEGSQDGSVWIVAGQ